MDTRLHQQQQRRQQIGHSRRNPSTSTEDTDPFPEVLSWAALIDVQTTLRSPQTIPSDVLSKLEDSYTSSFEFTSTEQEETDESEDELDEDDMSVLSTLFDPTTLHVGVDLTCLEGLDDELLLCPYDAFAAVCWADAIRSRDPPASPASPARTPAPAQAPTPSPVSAPTSTPTPAPAPTSSVSAPSSPPSYEDALLSRRSTPKYRPSPLNPSRSRHAHVIPRFPTSDGSDSDSDDARTFTDGMSPTNTTETAVSSTIHMDSAYPAPAPSDGGISPDEFMDSPSSPLYSALPKGKTLFFEEYNTSFMLLEPHFPMSDPKDSVGYFPIPNNTARPRSKSNCIAAFCANLPSRLGKSS